MDVPILGVFWKLLGIVLPWLGGKQARRRAFIAQRVGPVEGFLNTTDEYLELLEGHAERQGALGAGRVERVRDLCREMSHALLPNYLASHSALEAIADEKLTTAFREAERMGGAVRGFAQVVSARAEEGRRPQANQRHERTSPMSSSYVSAKRPSQVAIRASFARTRASLPQGSRT